MCLHDGIIHHNDSKFGPHFARIAATSGIKILKTPYHAPVFVDEVEDCMESALARRVGWIQEAAEERFEQLELNIFIQRVEVTAEPYRVVEAMIQKHGWAGITREQG